MKYLLTLLLATVSVFGQIQTINPTDFVSSGPAKLNSNFTWLNSYKTGRFSGSGAPGTIALTTLGDKYYDTVSFLEYTCYNVSGCTAVAAGNWQVNSGAVSSVFGRTGAVVATSGDYTASQVTGLTYQLVGVNSVTQTGRSRINIIPGPNTTVVATDNPGTNSTDVVVSSTGGGSASCTTSGSSTTVLTTEASATSATPCIYEQNATGTLFTFTSSPTVTITSNPTVSGTCAWYLYINSSGQEEIQIATSCGGSYTGASVNVLTVSAPSFPAGTFPKANGLLTGGNGNWTTVVNKIPSAGNWTNITAGDGIGTITNGVIPVDSTVARRGATNTFTALQDVSGGQFKFPSSNVSGLPSASANTNKIYLVSDGTSSSDCTTGSGTSQALCVSTGSAWTALSGSGGGVSDTLIKYASVALSSSQIKNLVGTPITLVAAPGANKYIQVLDVCVVYIYGSATYTAGANTFIVYGNGASVVNGFGSGFITSAFTAASSLVTCQPAANYQATATASVVNQPITTNNATTNFATGDGTAYIHISYRIVPTNG